MFDREFFRAIMVGEEGRGPIRSGRAEELKLGPGNSAKGGGRARAIAFPPAKEF